MTTHPFMPKSTVKAYSYIRFSSAEQKKGDSLRRQLEASRKYAEKHGMELDDTLRDEGVSAFKGKHAKEGALRSFLEAVKTGAVKTGSVLIVENLDRLSRQDIIPALEQFLAILNAGVKIVTLSDGMEYEKATLNPMQLIVSITVMSRAHEESATKATRLSSSWDNKRANIGHTKLTGICPGWLKLSTDKTRYEPIPDRVALVQRMFQMAKDGMGKYVIASTFNKEGIETWGIGGKKGVGWQNSYIDKIFHGRAVLGEYQPHKMVAGKRAPVGEVQPDYFPRIIDEELYFAVSSSRSKRASTPGRIGAGVPNLFANLCKCSQCGGTAAYHDKGDPNWRYLKCKLTVEGVKQCTPYSMRYQTVEDMFVKWIVDFDFTGGANAAKGARETQLNALLGRKTASEARVKRLYEALASGAAMKGLPGMIADEEAKVNELEAQEAHLRHEIAGMVDAIQGGNIKELTKKVENRFRLREEIRKRVEAVTVFFGGDGSWADPCIGVTLKDGTNHMIYSTESQVIRTTDGRKLESNPVKDPIYGKQDMNPHSLKEMKGPRRGAGRQ